MKQAALHNCMGSKDSSVGIGKWYDIMDKKAVLPQIFVL
tara:strand:- start:20 stop:136 length:117 start_codon:yes stop_codon:yes gene_type:complete